MLKRILLFLVLGCGFFSAYASTVLESDETRINPRYLLMDANGRGVSNEDFSGRFQLITFGYTFCPDICPTTLVTMAEVLQLLGDDAERLQGLFVSVDPERDTPAVLRTYTAFFDPRILGLTGSPDLIKRAAQHFRVRYEKVMVQGQAPEHYAVDHSAGMYLLGPEGQYIRKFSFGTPPVEIAREIRNYMHEQ